jgi:hypothetical protein
MVRFRRNETAFTRGFRAFWLRDFGSLCLRQSGLGVSDAGEGDEHGEEAQSIKKEISRHTEERHGEAAERRA